MTLDEAITYKFYTPAILSIGIVQALAVITIITSPFLLIWTDVRFFALVDLTACFTIMLSAVFYKLISWMIGVSYKDLREKTVKHWTDDIELNELLDKIKNNTDVGIKSTEKH